MGAQLRVYRQKIRSAQTTKKITRAMELISASRIQKAQARATAAAAYEVAITRAVSAVATFTNHINHPLVEEPVEIRRSAIVLMASDRGLAGAFNVNVLHEAEGLADLLRQQGKEVVFYLVGRKATGYFDFREIPYRRSWVGITDHPKIVTANEITDDITASFLADYEDGGVGEIHVVYNKFVSRLAQVPEVVRLLPLKVVAESSTEGYPQEVFPMYRFEPSVEEVLDALLPQYLRTKIFAALMQSSAAKHAATQKAMKSASDNADKLITNYTRLANTARQSEITQQISEIVGGADALAQTLDEE